jgi:hypothetical protein
MMKLLDERFARIGWPAVLGFFVEEDINPSPLGHALRVLQKSSDGFINLLLRLGVGTILKDYSIGGNIVVVVDNVETGTRSELGHDAVVKEPPHSSISLTLSRGRKSSTSYPLSLASDTFHFSCSREFSPHRPRQAIPI